MCIVLKKNPDAYKYLCDNIDLNRKKLIGTIKTFLGDFRNLKNSKSAREIKNNVDFIIMNLPENNLEFINELPFYVKRNKETLLIIYLFSPRPKPIELALNKLSSTLKKSNLKIIKVNFSRIVKNYSPHSFSIVLDVFISFS